MQSILYLLLFAVAVEQLHDVGPRDPELSPLDGIAIQPSSSIPRIEWTNLRVLLYRRPYKYPWDPAEQSPFKPARNPFLSLSLQHISGLRKLPRTEELLLGEPDRHDITPFGPLLVIQRSANCRFWDSDNMERIIRPVSRQLLRSHPRYPFSIPPPVYAKRLYSMGHTVPPVSYWEIG